MRSPFRRRMMEEDEPKMLCTEDDLAALASLKEGCEALVNEIRRLAEDVVTPDRTEKMAAVRREFDQKVKELENYVALLQIPAPAEEGEPI